MMEAWKRKPLADYFSIEDRQLAVLQKIFPDIGRRVTQMSASPYTVAGVTIITMSGSQDQN